jgi:hypothetical protein
MGLFSPFTAALVAAGMPNLLTRMAEELALKRAAEADTKTIYWLAGEVAERLDISLLEAIARLVGVASNGGPDLRTPKGWACVSALLGVPGAPILPTIH